MKRFIFVITLTIIVLTLPPFTFAVENSPVFSDIIWGNPVKVNGTEGSDNWPLTWHGDGELYGSGGDGNSCGGGTRVSAWFAKFSGNDPKTLNCTATNRDLDPGGGSGSSGQKGAGVISVGGKIYMFMRNADRNGNGCLLKDSADNGVSWINRFTFNEFGYCVFVNYGKAYAGVPAHAGNYVYMVTHNKNSAYERGDGFYLLRVDKGSIANKASWQVYSGGGSSSPQWSSNMTQAVEVFKPGHLSIRSGMNYHPPSGRYLWWMQHGGPDTRFNGTFSVYDATQPWGPWTVVGTWTWSGPGPGDGGNFPAKFMSSDGATLWLAFSGDDQLYFRQATLQYRNQFSPAPSPSLTPSPSAPVVPSPSASLKPSATPSPTPCPPGDSNCDGVVDASELKVIISGYLTTSPDLTGDTKVNSLDISLALKYF